MQNTVTDPRAELLSMARTMRTALEPGLARDADGQAISAGSCLYASILVAESLARFFSASVVVRGGSGENQVGARDTLGRWHGHYWLEARTLCGAHWVIDITADQFGHDPVRVIPLREANDYRPGDQAEVDAAVLLIREDLASD